VLVLVVLDILVVAILLFLVVAVFLVADRVLSFVWKLFIKCSSLLFASNPY